MQNEQKFYNKTWFIMMLLVSPLFFIGLILAWREKGIPVYFKIGFTAVWIYAVIFTFQSQDVERMFMTPEQIEVREEALYREQLTTIVAEVEEHEEMYGEFSTAEPIQKFQRPTYDSAYDVNTRMGNYMFYFKDKKLLLVKDSKGKEMAKTLNP